MGIPLISLIPKIVKTAGKVLGIDSLGDIVDALDKNRMTPEQRIAVEAALREHEKEMLEVVLSETNLMIQSEDKYVKRARPTGLYVAYAISIGLSAALIFGVKVDAASILTICAPLYGAQGYYMHLRTKEKMNGGSE